MVYVFSSVYDDITLIQQFVEHYVRIGVDQIVLNVNTYQDPLMAAKVSARCRDYPVTVALVYCEPQTWRIQNRLRNEVQDWFMGAEDWGIIADLDEFQEYPFDLKAVLRCCDDRGETSIYGTLLDRVARSGRLTKLRDDQPIGEQFPIGVPLTRDVLKAPTEKVVAVRGFVRPSGSCVAATALMEGFGVSISTVRATIHHYKWHAGVIPKLRERAELYRRAFREGDQAFRNYEESERFLCYYEAEGRIRLEEFPPATVLNLVYGGQSRSPCPKTDFRQDNIAEGFEGRISKG